MTSYSESKYKWYILALGTATHMFVFAMAFSCMPVLFKEISEDLNLNLVQVGTIWGMAGLAGVFISLFAGLVSDRYGSRLTLGLACLLVGIVGALRGLSGDFTSLAIYMFLFGLFGVPLTFTTHKAAAVWFSGQHLGLAIVLLALGVGAGGTLGAMISATVLSPLLGGWRNVMFVYGAVAILVGFLWLRARRTPSQSGAVGSIGEVTIRKALSHVTRIKAVWLLALVSMCLYGCRMGLTGYLPLYLLESGWTPVSADGALAALSAASVVGVIPLSLLSDRIGLRKVVVYPAILMTITGVGLLSAFGGAIVWPSVIFIGIVQEGLVAVMITLIIETKGVGAMYAGTALGLTMSLTRLGGFFSPPLGNSLAVINPSFAFIFWSALAVAALLMFYFVKETGRKKS
jgi:MFS family permease